jgi:hypothetical protein
MSQRVFTLNELPVCRAQAYKLIAAGKLVARKIGRKTVILEEDLDAFLKGLPVLSASEPSVAA